MWSHHPTRLAGHFVFVQFLECSHSPNSTGQLSDQSARRQLSLGDVMITAENTKYVGKPDKFMVFKSYFKASMNISHDKPNSASTNSENITALQIFSKATSKSILRPHGRLGTYTSRTIILLVKCIRGGLTRIVPRNWRIHNTKVKETLRVWNKLI